MLDYYVIERANNNNHPLLEWEQESIRSDKPTQITEPLQLRLGKPIPRKPQMVDYHSMPEPVIGKKIKDVLEPFNLHGVQLLPARVTGKDAVYDYWLLHVFNRIACVDRKNSVLSIDDDDGGIIDIKKLALDEKVLKEIPEEKRLVFVLAESTSTYLFHAKIKDAIMKVQPEGVRFIKSSEWGSGTAFT